MFTMKKKGTMLAKSPGTANQRQIVKRADDVSPRTLAKRDGSPDPRKVARLVLERIETFPETYHQSHWLGLRQKDGSVGVVDSSLCVNRLSGLSASEWSNCGTTGCVAGHTSAVAVELGLRSPTETVIVSGMAKQALKLTKKQADWLFEGDRSLEEVKTALNNIISGQSHKILNIPKSDGLLEDSCRSTAWYNRSFRSGTSKETETLLP